MKKDLLSIRDLSREEILRLIDRGLEIKRSGRRAHHPLSGYTLGLVFEKASTRTRVSFEAAMTRLGGHTLFLSTKSSQLSRNEPVRDTARVLSRYVDALAVRTYSQAMVEEMARWADIPVINALTDQHHPCQVLSDLMTVKEKLGRLEGMQIAWVGDGNNVAQSWVDSARVLGFRLTLACPSGYEPSKDVLEGAGENIRVVLEPAAAVAGAHVVNTDVWTSMGQEDETEKRLKAFLPYQINTTLVAQAQPDVIVMHCLPAHRGEEISGEVMDGPRSVVWEQAENRMHAQAALLELLAGD